MLDIVETITIAAPPAAVWALVTDVTRHPELAGPKSITKAIEFDGPVEVGKRWVAHEKTGPRRFDAESEITEVDEPRQFAWVSLPPMKEENRGTGGRVLWRYTLIPDAAGTRVEHGAIALEPKKGATPLKVLYRVLNLPRRTSEAMRTTLERLKQTAEGTGL